jgi:hypothetical protein
MASEAVRLLCAGERVRPNSHKTIPDVEDIDDHSTYSVISLESLIRMKRESNRDKDRAHVRNVIGAGLIDETWVNRYPLGCAIAYSQASIRQTVDQYRQSKPSTRPCTQKSVRLNSGAGRAGPKSAGPATPPRIGT